MTLRLKCSNRIKCSFVNSVCLLLFIIFINLMVQLQLISLSIAIDSIWNKLFYDIKLSIGKICPKIWNSKIESKFFEITFFIMLINAQFVEKWLTINKIVHHINWNWWMRMQTVTTCFRKAKCSSGNHTIIVLW